jgi:hypothetical protein
LVSQTPPTVNRLLYSVDRSQIGESTLPLFCLWMKNLGLSGEYLLRVFGLKDGLEFYVLDRENEGEYTDFCTNGPPGVCL